MQPNREPESAEPHPQIPVRGEANLPVEAADGKQRLPAHGGEAEHEVAPQDRHPLIACLEPEVLLVAAPDGVAVELEVGVRRQHI